MSESTTATVPPGRGLHRLALVAVGMLWPLIWLGGLVTTYDAGMSVPDWPGTYGYNLFLYPIDTWLFGPFDLLIEHGHRLLGAAVGLVSIAIVIASFWDPRRWVRGLAVGLLLAVIAQGILGGVRVVLSDRTLAMIHGCTGPAVFALAIVLAVVSGRRWSGHDRVGEGTGPASIPGGTLIGLLAVVVGVSYGQLLLGAQIRHVQPVTDPRSFAIMVGIHVFTAGALWLLAAVTWRGLRRCGDLTLSRVAAGLIGLVSLQIAFGVGTWVVNYGWPPFLAWMPGAASFLVRAKGFLDSMVVTAHVALGSLILGLSTALLLWAVRRRAMTSAEAGSSEQPTATGLGVVT